MSRSYVKLPGTPVSDVQKSEAPVASGAFADRPAAVAGSYAAGAAVSSPRSPLQLHGGGGGGGSNVQEIASSAFSGGGGGALPHQSTIEASFGTDMSSVQAYTGPAASKACDALGAQAFAMGNQIAFKEASPGAHVAAHEAAHVVQQSQGVQLSGGVGKAGDKYEVAADRAADCAVQGKSATSLLGTPGRGSGDGVQRKDAPLAPLGAAKAGVQLLGTGLDEELPEGAEAPGHGETKGKQRRYTVEQYVKMWEAERGRPMTKAEEKTLARGCIGITALNLEAGNPPLDNAYATFDQAKKVVDEWNAFIEAHKGERTSDGKVVGHFKAVLFAKLFWSNQSPDPEERKKPDDKAYLPDEDGKVDMSDYEYRAQGGGKWVNFDYGFWDDSSNCFWHANHCQPGMEVFQSTKDKFTAGYMDFDRIIFCAVIAKNYKAMNAAAAH